MYRIVINVLKICASSWSLAKVITKMHGQRNIKQITFTSTSSAGRVLSSSGVRTKAVRSLNSVTKLLSYNITQTHIFETGPCQCNNVTK
jgi:hypothetical protein